MIQFSKDRFFHKPVYYLFEYFNDLIKFSYNEHKNKKHKKLFKLFINKSNPNRDFTIDWKQRAIRDDSNTEIKHDNHYVYHMSWAIRKLLQLKPEKHVDIGSHLFFVSMASGICPIDFYDYRKAKLNLPELNLGTADLMNLHFPDNSIDSLSCMHAMEHVGLGRYGDEIDPDGDVKGINELKRVVKKGGNLFFVVPISGKPTIIYNSHRIYSYEQILELFEGCDLIEFSLVTDTNDFIINATKIDSDKQLFGCGCFWFRKQGV